VDTALADPAATPLNQALHQSVDALDGIPSAAMRRERSHQPAPLPDGPEARAFVAFLAGRTTKKSATARAKELNYNKSDETRQSKMLEARGREWANWHNFKAVPVLSPPEVAKYLLPHPDADVIPTRWVDTLKSQPWELDRNKARLVVSGDLEAEGNARTDSPRCSQPTFSLVLSVCAAKRWCLRGGDITAAFLQGENITRVLVLSPPKDGIEGDRSHLSQHCGEVEANSFDHDQKETPRSPGKQRRDQSAAKHPGKPELGCTSL
jgi:hypothetical protein